MRPAGALAALTTIVAALTGVLLLAAAPAGATETTTADIRADIAALSESLGQYSAERRDELTRRARTTLDSVDARIEVLERELDAGAAKLSEETRARKRETLQNLRSARTRVARWYGALEHGSRDAWTEIRDGFAGAWHSMRDAFDDPE